MSLGVREENRARMLREIQGAALDLVEQNGLAATTVAEIAERVGISERTVFRYFPSKVDALMPVQQRLVDALVTCESPQTGAAGIVADLLAVCRAEFAREVEQRDFRRISRLLLREPELLQAVAGQERAMVEALTAALMARGQLRHLAALLVAEVVTTTWRVTWEAFAHEDDRGADPDPVALFDETVRELGGLLPTR